jgi:hypothetical protein
MKDKTVANEILPGRCGRGEAAAGAIGGNC